MNYDFDVAYGDVFQAVLTVSPGGVPIDWSVAGTSMDGQIRLDPRAPSVAPFVFAPDMSVPATGINRVSLATAGLATGVYSYSFRLLQPGGLIRTMLQGKFRILDNATTTGGGPNP